MGNKERRHYNSYMDLTYGCRANDLRIDRKCSYKSWHSTNVYHFDGRRFTLPRTRDLRPSGVVRAARERKESGRD